MTPPPQSSKKIIPLISCSDISLDLNYMYSGSCFIRPPLRETVWLTRPLRNIPNDISISTCIIIPYLSGQMGGLFKQGLM